MRPEPVWALASPTTMVSRTEWVFGALMISRNLSIGKNSLIFRNLSIGKNSLIMQEEVATGGLNNSEIFMFTDNATVESCAE